MSKPYDATTKDLVQTRPADWLPYLGLPAYAVEVIEAELSTITQAADKVLRVLAPVPWLLHLELQSGHDAGLIERILLYNVLLYARYKQPVQSVIVLLSEKANRSSITGVLQRRLPDMRLCHEFYYDIVRVWQKPVEEVLRGGLGTLPLAPIANVTEAELPGIIHRMKTRLETETTPEEAGKLWTATDILMGLRYSKDVAAQLLQGVQTMKESVTYQAIVEEGRQEGRADEARRILLRQGIKRFGLPSEAIQNTLEATTSLDILEALTIRILDVESWDELLTLS